MKTILRYTTIYLILQGLLLLSPLQLSGAISSDPVKTDTLTFKLMDPASGVQFYKDNIITLSNSKYQQKMIADHIPFGQTGTYLINPDALDGYKNPMFIAGNPFPLNPDGMAFSSDYSVLYFTALEEGARPGTPEKIYSVPIEESQSSGQAVINKTEIAILPFCNNNNSYMHPAVASDNSFIIFASDNSKSMGGSDLFMVKKDGEKWGDPVSLGSSINTRKNEIYPFLDSENNLYFSSEGHSGFGGFDIYLCKFLEGGWGKPVNLMKSVNSEDDEVAITVDQKNKSAFFSVINRPGENSKQLYKINAGTSGKLSDALLVQADAKLAEAAVVTQVAVSTLQEEEPAGEEAVKAQTQTTMGSGGNAGAAAVTTAAAAALVTTAAIDEKPEEKPVEKVEDTETVFFRVQITSSSKAKTNYKVTIDGKSYPTFEYLYKGAYRYTVGNFRTVSEANAFKNKCRSSGFSQAFVAAFINDVRETDPAVFKR